MQLCTAKKSEREKQNISFSVSKYINIHKFHWNWFYTLVALSYRIAHYLTSSHIPFFFIVARPRFFSQQNLQKCSRLDETGQVCVYACVRRPLQNEHGCMRALRLIFTSTMWPRWLCPRRLCWCRMGTADLRGFSHTHTRTRNKNKWSQFCGWKHLVRERGGQSEENIQTGLNKHSNKRSLQPWRVEKHLKMPNLQTRNRIDEDRKSIT